MIKVVLDVYGADYSPTEPLIGAIKALELSKDLHIIAVGKQDEITNELKKLNADLNRFTIVDAPDVIKNTDTPTVAIKNKTNSSLVVSLEQVKLSDVYGMVSGGSTGSILTGAFLKIGRIKGVSRPALCPLLPTVVNGKDVAIVDSGANVDCKPINLAHFAIMGNAYVKNVCGVNEPKVALLSIGTEDNKGNDLVHNTFPILKEIKTLNFVGNMEARDLLTGEYDVVVSDGFSGNVLLKGSEGAISAFQKILKNEIKSSFISKIGALLLKKSFKNLKRKIDFNYRPGAVLLGCKKVVVKAHGAAKSNSFKECILQVVKMAQANICKIIEEEISKVEINVIE